jgi:O-antigen/teichoic acid export membrane protein
MLSAGRAKHLTVINTLASLVMLVLLFGLVPLFGAVGAAVAQTTFQFVWLLFAYRAALQVLATPQPKAA